MELENTLRAERGRGNCWGKQPLLVTRRIHRSKNAVESTPGIDEAQ